LGLGFQSPTAILLYTVMTINASLRKDAKLKTAVAYNGKLPNEQL